MRRLVRNVTLILAALLLSPGTTAAQGAFGGSAGTAGVRFSGDLLSGDLQSNLADSSTYALEHPDELLTGVLASVPGQPSNTSAGSAGLAPGSAVMGAPASHPGHLGGGGEAGVRSQVSAAKSPMLPKYGIGSMGVGRFEAAKPYDPGQRFAPPGVGSLHGMDWDLLAATDKLCRDEKKPGADPLCSTVTSTLTEEPDDFSRDAGGDIYFEYVSALSGSILTGRRALLLGLGSLGLLGCAAAMLAARLQKRRRSVQC